MLVLSALAGPTCGPDKHTFFASHFMETMNELAGYMSTNSEPDLSHMEECSSDEEQASPVQVNKVIKTAKAVSAVSAVPSVNVQRFDFIPMRLTENERRLLQVLENALHVCEYTDVVDVTFSHTKKSKQSRIFESLVDILSISCGLLVSVTLF